MDVTYQTYVGYLPASRSGLSPARWSIQHLCSRCQDYVATEALIAHTESHELADAVGQRSAHLFQSEECSGTMTPEYT